MPKVGEKAPPVTGKDQNGKEWSLADVAGKKVVLLYFYPKDDTPGCTKEACGIRDHWAGFQKAGLHVYGVSKDDAKSHAKFTEKYSLPFPLLTADEANLDKLGAWQEKSMYGKKYMGIARTTYLVGPDGKVAKHYPKVKPEEHAQEILADFKALA